MNVEGNDPTLSIHREYTLSGRVSGPNPFVRVSSSLLGPVDPSFRALSGRLKFTVRPHKFNKDPLPPLKPPLMLQILRVLFWRGGHTVEYDTSIKSQLASRN